MIYLFNPITIILVCFVIFHASDGCPEPDLIDPCVCEGNKIYCGGNEDLDLVDIFNKLAKNSSESEKHFKLFQLNNTAITELKDNTFSDITFNEIVLNSCTKLTNIQTNAFSKTDLVTSKLVFLNNTRLSSVFEILSKFINAENITLIDNYITEIPSHAFRNIQGYQDKLAYLQIASTETLGMGNVKKIGNYSFYNLRHLKRLRLDKTLINGLPEYAFAFEQESNETLNLSLSYYASADFHPGSFLHFKRPTVLDLGYLNNYITILNENIYQRFLELNDKNILIMTSNYIYCDDCKNYWVRKNPELLKRIIDLRCRSGNVTDKDKFNTCGPYSYLNQCSFRGIDNSISCGPFGGSHLDIKGIFANFSSQLQDHEKHFHEFTLFSSDIYELKENTFNDITFERIDIENNDNLAKIDKNAFTDTVLMTKSLIIQGNRKLNLLESSIYEILGRFSSIEFIELQNNNLTEIPSNAFQPINGHQRHLNTLLLWEYKINNLGSKAFYYLNNLIRLDITGGYLEFISDYAFEFERPSNNTLNINLGGNRLNSSSFFEKSFINIQRPTKLSLSYIGNFTYLDEKAFLPFLLENKKNMINMYLKTLDCNDCNNYWLVKHSYLIPRLEMTSCSNYKAILDKDNFKNCN